MDSSFEKWESTDDQRTKAETEREEMLGGRFILTPVEENEIRERLRGEGKSEEEIKKAVEEKRKEMAEATKRLRDVQGERARKETEEALRKELGNG